MAGVRAASRWWGPWLALLAACGARTGLDDLRVALGPADGGGSSGSDAASGGGSGSGSGVGAASDADGAATPPDGGPLFVDDAGGDDDGAGGPASACGPATCDGCCSGRTCRPGLAREACGHGGQACRFCDPELSCSLTARQCM